MLVEKNPLLLKMIDLKVADMKKGIDIDIFDYKDKAVSALIDKVIEFKNSNPYNELYDKWVHMIYLKIKKGENNDRTNRKIKNRAYPGGK